MKMKYWSEFDKYIVMVHGKGNTPKGVLLGYEAFLDFKRVKEALMSMSKAGGSYSYDGDIYKRPITSSRATQILQKIEECRWDDDIRVVAKQIGAGGMLSPAKKHTTGLK